MRQLAELVPTPHRFTVAEYMGLPLEQRTELLGGVIYDVSPKNERHARAVRLLTKALVRGLSDAYAVSVQDPIAVAGRLGPHAPEIDVAVIAAKDYSQTPTDADSRAFIEVSDATYAADRRMKIPLLVASDVPTWHVNVPARQVEVYALGPDFSTPRVVREGETIDVLGVPIAVSNLFAAP